MKKISARSEEVKRKLSVVQSCDLDEKPFFEKIVFLVTASRGHSIAIDRMRSCIRRSKDQHMVYPIMRRIYR